MKTTYQLPNNQTLNIIEDVNCDTPRSWSNLTTMIFFGKYKNLGDNHIFNTNGIINWNGMEIAIKKHYGRDLVHIQKVYGYSHSGLTISLNEFSCHFDSGILGFVIITRQSIREILTT